MRDLLSWNLLVGRYGGVEVRFHVLLIGWLAVAAVVQSAQSATLAPWFAVSTTLVLLGSLLLHEAGHVLAAVRLGGQVREVVLWPLGGLVWPQLTRRPLAERIVALAGPAANLAVSLSASIVLWWLGGFDRYLLNPFAPPSSGSEFLWPEFLRLVVWVNWLLALVNLLPGVPLDGGRIWGSVLWEFIGFRSAVLRIAQLGKLSALGVGLIGYLVRDAYPAASIPLVLLACFLYFSARQEADRLTNNQRKSTASGSGGGVVQAVRGAEADGKRSRKSASRHAAENSAAVSGASSSDPQPSDEDQLVDAVLARLFLHGMDALSPAERELLDRASSRYRNRPQG